MSNSFEKFIDFRTLGVYTPRPLFYTDDSNKIDPKKMTVFVIISKSPLNPSLDGAIAANFAIGDAFKITDGQWLVSADMTARQVTEKLGILTNPALVSTAVFSISNYFGRHSAEMWEWLKLKMERPAT